MQFLPHLKRWSTDDTDLTDLRGFLIGDNRNCLCYLCSVLKLLSSKPDGGGGESIVKRDINDYYNLKPHKLEGLLQKKYSSGYRKETQGTVKRREPKIKNILLDKFNNRSCYCGSPIILSLQNI